MQTLERNELFEQFWPDMKNLIKHIWFKYKTVKRIGTLEDVMNEAALSVLTALDNFHPASSYETPHKKRHHILGYCKQVIHNALIHKSRLSSLVHVPACVAGEVFGGREELTDARLALDCVHISSMPIMIAERARGEEEHTVEELQTALRRLTPYERGVIGMYWGLDSKEHSMREIAEQHGLTRNAARRRLKAIETKIRLIMQKD